MPLGQAYGRCCQHQTSPEAQCGGLVYRGLRWRNWLRLGLPHARALVRGLRKEEQDFLHRLVLPAGSNGSRRAIQHRDSASAYSGLGL